MICPILAALAGFAAGLALGTHDRAFLRVQLQLARREATEANADLERVIAERDKARAVAAQLNAESEHRERLASVSVGRGPHRKWLA